MITQPLLDFIRDQLAKGVTVEEIKNKLLANNWQMADVDAAFQAITAPNAGPQNIPPSNVPEIHESAPKVPKKNLGLAFIIVGALFIVGGGVYAFYTYFGENPQKIVDGLAARMQSFTSAELTTDVTVRADRLPKTTNSTLPLAPTTGTYTVHAEGVYEMKDDVKADIKFSASAEGMGAFTLSLRMLDGITYVKTGPLPKIIPYDLSFLENKWIKIDPDAIRRQFSPPSAAPEPTPQPNAQKQALETFKKMRDVMAKHKTLTVTKVLASETIDGMEMHHFSYMYNRAETKALYIELLDATKNTTVNFSPTKPDTAQIDAFLDMLQKTTGEIWIGKKDLLLHRLTFTLTVDPKDGTGAKGTLTFSTTAKNFNAPVTVETPSPIITMEEIMQQFFSTTTQSSNTNRRNGF